MDERRTKQNRVAQVVATALAGLAVIALLGGVKYLQISAAIAQHANFAPPPEAITSLVTQEESWSDQLPAVGTLAASEGVVLGAEEAGKVSRVLVESGVPVAQGAMLVELDTSVEEANLRGAVALAEQAKQNLSRAQALRARNANSLADLESAQAAAREAEAAVESLKATIGRKKITAPFAGRTGIRQVNVGQFVNPGTPIIPLYKLDPLFVNFSLPEQSVSRISNGQTVRVTVDAFPGEKFEGKITTINPQINPTTRNIEVQATLPNPGERLRPGMFASIEVLLPEQQKVIAIPASSITYAPYGDTVYVVEQMKSPDGKEYLGVRQQVVKLGAKRGDQVAVLGGLKPGDQVATSGGFKLRPGAAVSINNSLAPGNNPAPKPADT